MPERRFDIVFNGKTRADLPVKQVRDAFAHLFKVPAERVAPLFSGKPCVLKKDLSEKDAGKYQAVLAGIGAEVELRERECETIAGATSPATPVAVAYDLTVAPLGKLLRTSEHPQPPAVADIAITHLSLAPVFAPVETTQPPPPPPPDTSAITLADPDIKLAPTAASETPPAPPTDHLTLALVGPFPSTAGPVPPPAPDTTAITLAPLGEDLLKPEEQPRTAAAPAINAEFTLLDKPVDDIPP